VGHGGLSACIGLKNQAVAAFTNNQAGPVAAETFTSRMRDPKSNLMKLINILDGLIKVDHISFGNAWRN
jgi:hypothetical protein